MVNPRCESCKGEPKSLRQYVANKMAVLKDSMDHREKICDVELS